MFEPQVLFTLAEIAVALAGFSAVVVLFKRRDGGEWATADADRFHGMVLHAMAAVFFSLLPSMIDVFVARPDLVWRIASGLFALQILLHVSVVLRLASTTGQSRYFMVVGLLAAGLLALNGVGVGFEGEFGPYLIGVLWHVLQSATLFVWLIWIPQGQIRSDLD
ncbi:MAG: hypothetical protein ACQGVK_19540 [Myxococcota bacterium]